MTAAGLTAHDAAQDGFAYRFGWGRPDLEVLAPHCDVVVIVDVLRFTSAVSAACDQGVVVYPYGSGDETAGAFAAERHAVVAGRREDGPISLSPTDLLHALPGTRIVLPSPNGADLAVRASELGVPFVLAGTFRNASATARRARALAHDAAIGVVAAGERWPHDQRALRPCAEDLIGAGAVLAALDPAASLSPPACSPEAAAARAAFVDAKPLLGRTLAATASARELARAGSGDDVATAVCLDVSANAAQLVDGAFIAV